MNFNSTQEVNLREKPWNSILSEVISSYCFVNIGVIKKIHNENFIDVSFYYGLDNSVDVVDVRLLHIGTTKCKIIVKPEVGDNVLLLTPRDFIEELEFNREKKASEVMFQKYNDSNMCALLIKDDSDDNVKTQINVDENGNASVQTEGNINVDSDETVCLDGDAFGGLCKTQELQTQLGYLTARVDAIINALEQSATGSQDGGATYKTNITIALNAIANKEDFSNIENAKIKHGDGSSS